jgi:hypothetical protein
LGFKQCDLDPAVFFVHHESILRGVICVHVDDFLHAGDIYFDGLMNQLRQRFSAGKIAEGKFLYIGFAVNQSNNSIILDHSQYMDKIQGVSLEPDILTNKSRALNATEQTLFRQLVGQLNWAVQGSRPDLAYDMIVLSTKLKSGTVGDLTKAVKLTNRLKDINSIIVFPNLNNDYSKWKMLVFTDASLGNLNDGTGSTGAHILWIVDNEGKCCPITWCANKIKRVVRSTIAAEALSLQEGLESAFYYRKLLSNILGLTSNSIPIIAYTDNKSVQDAIYSTKMVDDKRLRVDIASIQELLQKQEIDEVRWCNGSKQLANCMTKQGGSGYELLKVLHTGMMLKDFI